MKIVSVLGATGSVGRRTLELVAQFPEEFRVAGLAARGTNLPTLVEQVRLHRPQAVALLDRTAIDRLARELPAPRPELLAGPEGLVTLAASVEADIVLSALVGGAGLLPTLAAIRAGRTVALANKEPLVMAGALMTAAARQHGATLLPVDSEHSAIFQCLAGRSPAEVKRLILTASGGPFARFSREALDAVTVAQALQHPTWRMGAKITIDSATLMNKGLEVIEARWLFDVPLERVDVVVHPQSIVHSMVEFIDGSVLAQLGMPDMGIPILYGAQLPRPAAVPGADGRLREDRRADLRGARRRSLSVPAPGPRGRPGGRGGPRRAERGERGGGGGLPRRALPVHGHSAAHREGAGRPRRRRGRRPRGLPGVDAEVRRWTEAAVRS